MDTTVVLNMKIRCTRIRFGFFYWDMLIELGYKAWSKHIML